VDFERNRDFSPTIRFGLQSQIDTPDRADVEPFHAGRIQGAITFRLCGWAVNPVVQLEGPKAKKHAEHVRLARRPICSVWLESRLVVGLLD
jgi:hypothetical protein